MLVAVRLSSSLVRRRHWYSRRAALYSGREAKLVVFVDLVGWLHFHRLFGFGCVSVDDLLDVDGLDFVEILVLRFAFLRADEIEYSFRWPSG